MLQPLGNQRCLLARKNGIEDAEGLAIALSYALLSNIGFLTNVGQASVSYATSILSQTVRGSGIASPSSRIPLRCTAMASLIRSFVSSTVAPVAMHPGRS